MHDYLLMQGLRRRLPVVVLRICYVHICKAPVRSEFALHSNQSALGAAQHWVLTVPLRKRDC